MRIAIIELMARAGQEAAVADFLQAHASRSRVFEEDCLDFQIANNPEDLENFFIVMTFASADAQARHRETEHFKRFLDECMPLLLDAPDGTKFFSRKLLDRIA